MYVYSKNVTILDMVSLSLESRQKEVYVVFSFLYVFGLDIYGIRVNVRSPKVSNGTRYRHIFSFLKGKWETPKLLTQIFYLTVIGLIVLFSTSLNNVRTPVVHFLFIYGVFFGISLRIYERSDPFPLLPTSVESPVIYETLVLFIQESSFPLFSDRQTRTLIGQKSGRWVHIRRDQLL